ncbi:DNA-binding MarR family transcriptional regulator [Hamadaea flava]|uniref:MarR family winged helix-turn-helix transcriptional regulator n=1 Tax=Hamadaea flava TaxID=1742688 RepID=A0ABV8LM40_9ACTN|nr:MarR family transcriptional regulator [Hamadaea flava]MCP2321563.1 DNA-binding MarR family transcriptional regulator [Hamadaea flava]
MRTDPLADAELTYLMGLGFQLVLGEFVRRMDAAGHSDLRPVHGAVFQALKGPGATGTELAERLGVTKQAAGQLVDDLEARGYVRREPHPAGGRRKLVVLTEQAEAHLRAAGRVLHGLEAELEGSLGAAELSQLRTALARLIREMTGDTLPALRPQW